MTDRIIFNVDKRLYESAQELQFVLEQIAQKPLDDKQSNRAAKITDKCRKELNNLIREMKEEK